MVVLTWNDGHLLSSAVGSLLASTGVDVSVTVVDNGSEPPAVIPDDPRVVLVRNETNRGVAVARNQGAERGVGEFVCFLDSDAEVRSDCLALLVDELPRRGAVAMAAPVCQGQRAEASAGRGPSIGRKLARALGLTSTYAPGTGRVAGAPSWEVDFAIGACQLWRREAFEAIGGFDEDYFYGPEDIDACRRARVAGWRLVQVADAGVHHPPRRRHRRILTRPGGRHAAALARYYWRALTAHPIQ